MVSGSLTRLRLGSRPGTPSFDSPMLIVCPNCATSYPVKPSSLGAAGRSVRCVRCQTVWFAASAPEQADTSDTESSDWSSPLYGGGPFFEDDADLLEDRQEEPDRSDAPPEQRHPPSHAEPATAPAAVEPKSIEPKLHASPVIQERVPIYSPKMAAPNPAASAIRNTRAASIADTLEDIETFAARQIKQRRRRAPVRRQWSVPDPADDHLGAARANVVLIGWRSDVARLLPQTASLYRGDRIAHQSARARVQHRHEHHRDPGRRARAGGRGHDHGHIETGRRGPASAYFAPNPNGHEVHTWTAAPGRSVLSPGETIAFRSRLASPPADGQQVIVRFFNRRDMVAGLP